MQSIYGFRDAEVELFERVKSHGLETPSDPDSGPLRFDFVALSANFRTVPSLVNNLNGIFRDVFADDRDAGEDSSRVRFTEAEAARSSESKVAVELHLAFTRAGKAVDPQADLGDAPGEPATTREHQLESMVALIRLKMREMEEVQRRAKLDPEKKARYRIAVLGRKRAALLPIADALRKARIRFRSIDLVMLDERPEVLDALSLARAMVNPMDRTAWLGVLRAPWCGLSLEELHLLTSADEDEVIATPVPALLEERLPALYSSGLLNQRAYDAAARVERVLRSAAAQHADAASYALGTWLESIWKALGGDDTVDAEQRENLKRLWACLDGLKEGELDLTGPGLTEALKNLYALPDPESSNDFGVQLMTIHKSKGLEFEVVIVPDLEARESSGDAVLMSWLERGLADSNDDESLTEFLIAPIQTKGASRSATREWVDGIKKEREKLEMRRVLYVVATRAREELHLFARPRFREKMTKAGSLERSLAAPTGLMATAWPALQETIQRRFEGWLETLADDRLRDAQTGILSDLAAASLTDKQGNLVQMPTPVRPTLVRRLPADYAAPLFPHSGLSGIGMQPGRSTENIALGEDGNNEARALFERTEGAMRSRLLGTAVHALMEESSRLRRGMDPEDASLALADSLLRIVADLRGHGLAERAAEQLGAQALTVTRETLLDPAGGWILAPHPEAESEVGWTGIISGKTWNIRPDRVFFAPSYDDPKGKALWWIIDYKTSYANEGERGVRMDDERAQVFLEEHRERHAKQLAAYAQVLRGLKQGAASGPTDAIRVNAGIYYPVLRLFDFWEA
jgi:ATP-dependent exoDNAse (exonuclease V) beta subunit